MLTLLVLFGGVVDLRHNGLDQSGDVQTQIVSSSDTQAVVIGVVDGGGLSTATVNPASGLRSVVLPAPSGQSLLLVVACTSDEVAAVQADFYSRSPCWTGVYTSSAIAGESSETPRFERFELLATMVVAVLCILWGSISWRLVLVALDRRWFL